MHIQYHITNLIDCKMYVIIRFSIGFQVISLLVVLFCRQTKFNHRAAQFNHSNENEKKLLIHHSSSPDWFWLRSGN